MSSSIKTAAHIIKNGGLVAFPTETVYGLGADALNQIAVAKIFDLKERPSFDPLIVHVTTLEMMESLVLDVDDRVYEIAERFWPGPLTIILPKKPIVPDIVTSGLQTVGIRMPDCRIAQELIVQAGCPIAAPSANKFGRVSPTEAAHVRKQLPGIDYILDGGKTAGGIESTIIRLHEKGFEILRHGLITREEIEEILPYTGNETLKSGDLITAPGMIKSHYSPEKPLYILYESCTGTFDRREAVLLSFSGENTDGYKYVEVLTKHKDIREYAVNLFAALHHYEESDVSCIIAEPVPEHGIGLAVMDKLRKAAYRYNSSELQGGS